MTDDWAAQTPSASAAKSQHGKLLPLLAPKAQDVRQLQAELAIAQDRAKALKRVNEELRNEAAEARKAELGTRPLMTRLMLTARISQGTLTKLVSAISDYNLTMEEKTYLHSLAENNDNMIEELKNDHPNFFERIFVDSDRDFDSWAKTVTESAGARAQEPASTSSELPGPATQQYSARKRASLHQPAYSLPIKSVQPTEPADKSIKAPPRLWKGEIPAYLSNRTQSANPPLLTSRSAHLSITHETPSVGPHQPSPHSSPPLRPAPLARMTVKRRSTATPPANAPLPADAPLITDAQDSSQETFQASEFLVQLGRALTPYDLATAPTVPLRARGSYDPFAKPVAPLGDVEVEDSQSGSTYDGSG